MSADSFTSPKGSVTACAAGFTAVIYGAALTLLAGTLAMPAARAAGDEHDRDHEERSQGERGQAHPEHGRGDRDRQIREREERRHYEQQHYWQYQRPVYVPPPVYEYPPQASPGITFVLPLEFRVR